MSKKLYAVGVIVLGIVAVVGTYQFRADRITPGRLAEIKKSEAEANKAEAAKKDAERKKADNVPDKQYPTLDELGPTPDMYVVSFRTSKGDVTVEVHKDWAPLSAERFYQLVMTGFFDGARFFRMVPPFVVQFGLAGDPKLNEQWNSKTFNDEPRKESNTRGTIVFAAPGVPNHRTTQVFINLSNNNGTTPDTTDLDKMGFVPFGKVISGMENVDKFYAGYGADPSENQALIAEYGNSYLDRTYPELDYIKEAIVVEGGAAPAAPAAPAPESAPAAPAPAQP